MIKKKVIIRERDNSSTSFGPGWIEVSPSATELDDASLSASGLVIPGPNHVLEKRLMEIVKQSKRIICISTFLIEETGILKALKEAAARGVSIYVLTSAEAQLGKDFDENLPADERVKVYLNMLSELGKFSLIRTGENLHSKFLIADPESDPAGLVLTSNMTMRAMRENLEVAVVLTREQVKSVFEQFRIGFLSIAKREKYGQGLTEIEKINLPEPEWNATFCTIEDRSSIRSNLIELVSNAKSSIRLSSWTIEPDDEVAKLVIDKAKKGVEVEIFTRPEKRNWAFLKELVPASRVYSYKWLHAKSAIIDDNWGVVMTSNIAKRGLSEGFETAVPLSKKQVTQMLLIMSFWRKYATLRFSKDVKLGEILSGAIVMKDGDLAEMHAPKLDVETKKLSQRCLSIDAFINGDAAFPNPGFNARKEEYEFTLTPPLLPDNVNEKNHKVERMQGVTIYSARGGPPIIAISDLEQITVAKRIQKEKGGKIVVDSKAFE